jgi:hypothetical protein
MKAGTIRDLVCLQECRLEGNLKTKFVTVHEDTGGEGMTLHRSGNNPGAGAETLSGCFKEKSISSRFWESKSELSGPNQELLNAN